MAASSPFLSLPGELRNQIYELCAMDMRCLKINIHGRVTPPSLMQVCRQIHKELGPIVLHMIGHKVGFEAYVTKFDFSHVMHCLRTMAPGSARRATIHLRITQRYMSFSMIASLGQWLTAAKQNSAIPLQHEDNGLARPFEPTFFDGEHILDVTYRGTLA